MSSTLNQLLDTSDLWGLPEHVEESLNYGQARCIAFNPAGTLLAAGCEGGEVVIWDCCTRGVARVFRGHRSPLAFVGWPGSSGRRLVSASTDGQVVVWDVLSGAQLASHVLDCCTPSDAASGGSGAAITVTSACLDASNEGQLLVSLSLGPAQFTDLETGEQTPLPAFVLETKGKIAARVLVQQGGESAGVAQTATLSSCGRLVFAATKGAVAVHRRADLALLDVVVLQNFQHVTAMSHGSSEDRGAWLLLLSQDRAIRVYGVEKGAEAAQPHDTSELKAISKPPKPKSTLLRGEGGPLLQYKREYQDSMEKKQPWACAAFSPDMEHVAAGMNNKHAIQRWNLLDGYAEGPLEAGQDWVVALAWHPTPLPRQLYSVGSTGTIYIWTKIVRENWCCFAPDFKELEENQEYVEREDEFDANPRPEDEEMTEAAEGSDGEVDIMGEGEAGAPAHSAPGTNGGGGAEPPLLFLPVTAADVLEALRRDQGGEQPEGGGDAQQQQQPQREAAGEAPAGQGGSESAGGAEGGNGGGEQQQRSSGAGDLQHDGATALDGGAGKRKRDD